MYKTDSFKLLTCVFWVFCMFVFALAKESVKEVILKSNFFWMISHLIKKNI